MNDAKTWNLNLTYLDQAPSAYDSQAKNPPERMHPQNQGNNSLELSQVQCIPVSKFKAGNSSRTHYSLPNVSVHSCGLCFKTSAMTMTSASDIGIESHPSKEWNSLKLAKLACTYTNQFVHITSSESKNNTSHRIWIE
jgi:hypothetical protein